jgi:hypothetical protein
MTRPVRVTGPWLALFAGLALGVGCAGGDDEGAPPPGPFPGEVTELELDDDGCLGGELDLAGLVPACRLVEALAPEASVTCLSFGRAPLDRPDDDSLRAELRTHLETQKLCGGDAPPCGSFAFCEVVPLDGEPSDIEACATDPTLTTPLYCACLNLPVQVAGSSGYCYLDPAAGIGSADAAACSSGASLRFVESPAVPSRPPAPRACSRSATADPTASR